MAVMDLPAKIHQSADHIGRQRNFSQFQAAHDLLDFLEFDTEHKLVEIKRAELVWLRHGSGWKLSACSMAAERFSLDMRLIAGISKSSVTRSLITTAY